MSQPSKNFAITGVGGYIAPRHLTAIRDVGGKLLAAVDPKDSVGILDRYSLDVRYFSEFERFDRQLDKLRRGTDAERVHYLTVCSPNYLHDAHCRLGMRVGADVICEKPLVISPWNLEPLQALESETGRRVWTILQLRVHPELLKLREKLAEKGDHDVELTYITSRGPWYDQSWKGDAGKSGGIPTNIGIHFFDMLLWLFGGVEDVRVHLIEARRMSGFIKLARAKVRWFLSIDHRDLPKEAKGSTFRRIAVDGQGVEFSDGFTDLHTRVYEQILAGNGCGIDVARPSVELAYRIRTTDAGKRDDTVHPMLGNRS